MKNALLAFFAVFLIAFPVLAVDKQKTESPQFVIPAFKTVDIEGKEFDLAKQKGKVVLVDFWATWCIPCLKEIPKLRKMHKAMHEKGFVIVGVANNSKGDLTKFFESSETVPWATIADAETVVAKDFKVKKWPTTVLIDRKGKLIGRDLHADELLSKVLKELDLKPDDAKEIREALKDLNAKSDETH